MPTEGVRGEKRIREREMTTRRRAKTMGAGGVRLKSGKDDHKSLKAVSGLI